MANATSTLGWLPALFDIAVVSLDSTGAVLECSEPALAVLSNGGLSISEGKLVANDPGDQGQLQRMLERGTAILRDPDSPQSPSFVGAIHIARQEPLPPLQAVMTRVHSAEEHPSGGQPAVMLFLCDPARHHSSRSQVLRSLYRLTPTEMRLIDQLVSGAKLKSAAKALNLTENTARFHLKEVFRKMRVDCQSALLSTILLLPSAGDGSASLAAYGADAAAYPGEPAPPPGHYRIAAPLKTKRPQVLDSPDNYRVTGKVFA